MARLRKASPVADRSSDESEFSQTERGAAKDGAKKDATAKLRTSPRKVKPMSYRVEEHSASDESACELSPMIQPKTPTQQRRRQIRLIPLNGNTSVSKKPNTLRLQNTTTAIPIIDKELHRAGLVATSDVEESLWCGSDDLSDGSEEALPSPRKFMHLPPKTIATKTLPNHSR